jgi:hypothetical protein
LKVVGEFDDRKLDWIIVEVKGPDFVYFSFRLFHYDGRPRSFLQQSSYSIGTADRPPAQCTKPKMTGQLLFGDWAFRNRRVEFFHPFA